jgi:Arylsulfotransferase (ASST)
MGRGARAGRVGLAMLAMGLSAACGGASSTPASASTPSVPYVLFAPLNSTVTYLMDLQGRLVHSWRSEAGPSLSVYLLPNGLLLRPRSLGTSSFPAGGGNGGRVEELNWDGSVAWSFDYFSTTFQQHHDVRWMPDGHVLLVAWEKKTAAEAIAAGRNPATIPENGEVWVDHIVEVDPATDQIVWEWHLWDHLLPPGGDPLAHPELVDPNAHATADTSDWTHANAVDYNPALDQVLLSVRNHSEIWIIDHSTTTAEAADHAGGRSGHGGDLLFRWGNPASYGLSTEQQLFGQHNAHWIPDGLSGAGEILLFDNGDKVLRAWSTAVQLAPTPLTDGNYAIDPATGFAPAAPDWQYTANPPESVFAAFISSAQRLPNDDTLICDGPAGHIFEVTPAGDTRWTYTLTDTTGATGVQVFRATRYEGDFSGLAGQSLEPQEPVQVEQAATSPEGSRAASGLNGEGW